MRVADLFSRRKLLSLPATATVLDAARAMTAGRVGAMIVTNDDGTLAGIFTERDLMARVVVVGKDPARARLSEVMTREVYSVGPAEHVTEVRRELQTRHIRHVPVVVDGKVVSVLSLRDILRADLDACAHDKEALETYLLGGTEPPAA